jgi:hypothetical protein
VLRCDFSAAVCVHNLPRCQDQYTCASVAERRVSYAHTRYVLHTYIGTHTSIVPSCIHPFIHPSTHCYYCCAAKPSAQALMSRHGTCHLPLPLLEMDATVAKCRTKHLISPKSGTRRCVCCRRVGKKYDTYRADATAMPGPASHKDHGSNSRSASPGKKRMCRSRSHALPPWSH